MFVARRQYRRFIHYIFEVGAGKSRSSFGNPAKVNVFFNNFSSRVDFKNRFAVVKVGRVKNDSAIKSARPEQGCVQNIRPVRGRENYDSFVWFKTVKLNKNLIQCLFSFVMSSAKASSPLSSNRVNFVNKDNGRGR